MGYEVKPVPKADGPPVVDPNAEHFDPDEFEMPWSALPPPPGPTRDDPVDPEFDHFDPDELKIDLPADPKPSSSA
jgi:hypothetical protein